MKNLQEIIQALKQIRTDTTTKVSDELVWESAVKIFISNKIQQGKQPQKPFSNSNLATKKQIDLLKKLKVGFDPNITKNEARMLIDLELGGKKK